MEPRLNFFQNAVVGQSIKHMIATNKVIAESGLSPVTRELAVLRASQINGCAGCIDMHTKDAEAAGESSVRLHLVAAWREATVFTDAERAALELSEEMTRIADAATGVSDEVWQNAAKHFEENELGALVMSIALINAFNRMNVATRQPAGNYQPGQYAH
ncbi:carboxymuconolactone decarboxylase family protein [Streptomyces indicus]|uniref:Alkylhydroperoxidase AhpD family core domain-containing protein n=1 Tax=Streptomyces indicus TaxID=417292 RepID=A0A1G8YP12_9ACTN|nr:carboxymuconolactone decarboxylase family protein [Streptomyces indicus]SDK04513.1 alkylhydroperoxidase AhpD family core domain-containing protein [Streptomyces indicus]